MENTKLFKNLKNLNKQEFNEFIKFVNSPYFLKRKSLPVLLNELLKHYPEFKISKEKLFIEAFPGVRYNELLARKYFSELNRMLEEFLAVSSFRTDKFSFAAKLTEKYTEMKNYDEAENTALDALKELEKNVLRNEKYYYNRYIFERHLKTISNLKTNLNPDTDWKQAMDSFVNYSALTVLQFYYIILNDNKFRFDKNNINLQVLNDLVKIYEKNIIPENPMAAILNNLVKASLEPDNEKYYKVIKSLLYRHQSLLESHELASIYTYLHNYCFVKVENGELDYLEERFEIVNKVLENKFHLKDGFMIPDMFVSMVINALMLKRFEWAEEFIKKFSNNLPDEEKRSTELFAISACFMFKGDYRMALENLKKVKFKKYYDKFKVKALNLMIFYEAGYYDSAFLQADTFRHFISKYKSITPYVRERSGNFIKQLIQLIKFRLGETDDPEIRDFNSVTVMFRPWLMQKILEVKK
jgi:hypothetical protein